MAVVYNINKTLLKKTSEKIHWNIDSSSELQPLKIINGRVVLQGWLLAEGEADPRVAIKVEHVTYSFPFNIKRPDVISAILKQSPENHQKIRCGFEVSIPFTTKIIIGLESDGLITWLEELLFLPA